MCHNIKKNNVAFLTTIFPMNENYLTTFLTSLEQQTYTDFDLVVVNDGYENFAALRIKYNKLNILELKYSNTYAKNREYGINFVIENGYEILIFGDSDDYFQENRVEKSISHLSKYDIVVNELSLFNNDKIYNEKYISNRILPNSEVGLDFIKDKNIFGMSNTAIKLYAIEKITFSPELSAIDWYLFSSLLIKGFKAIFTAETETFYRQHGDNIIGIKNLTKESLEKGIDLKIRQYQLLIKEDISYNKLLIDMYELQEKIKEKGQIELMKKQEISFPLWWEEIKLIKE